MSARNSDRNLLFGILALQMDFISRESLVKAMNDWVLDKAKPLGEILVANEALSSKHLVVLDQMVDAHVEAHEGDPEKSLAALSSVGSVRDDLADLEDDDVQDAMTYVSIAVSNASEDATISHAGPTPSSSIGEGSSLNSRFHIIRPHAEGGLGKVSVAMDRELNREVALKEIKAGYVHDESARTRFTLEAEITGGLEHPGIVPVYGLGHRDDGQPFYAMRFIKGDSLKDACTKFHEGKDQRSATENALEFRKLLGRYIDVCNAIEYAHSRGVLHRDLKPGNIMLGKYGETLVVDWGLAKAIGRDEVYKDLDEQTLQPSSSDSTPATQMGSALGTPHFMSPEQAEGKLDELGPASDVYSLGATLYYLLLNRSPFNDRNLDLVLAKVQTGEFQNPRELDLSLPKSIEAICLKAMALRPKDRYSSPSELANDVERWLADEPVEAGDEPISVRTRRWLRKHPKTVAAVSAAVVIGLIATISITAIVSKSNRSLVISEAAEKTARRDAEREAAKAEQQTLIANEQRDRADENAQLALVEARRANQQLYVAQINLAEKARLDGNIGKMLHILNGLQLSGTDDGDMRRFEWAYLWNFVGRCTLRNRFAGGTLVEFSPDGQILACAKDQYYGIALYAEDEHTANRRLVGHRDKINDLIFTPGTPRLISSSDDGTVRVWDLSTDKETRSFPGRRAAIDPSSTYLATCAGTLEPIMSVFELESGQELFSIKDDAMGPVSISSDGSFVAAGHEDGIGVWSLPSGELIQVIDSERIPNCLVFHPSRNLLVSAGFLDSVESVSSIAESPFLASSIRVWDVESGRLVRSFIGHDETVRSVAFDESGTTLVSGGDDQAIRLWDFETGVNRDVILGHVSGVAGIAIDGNRNRVASVGSRDQFLKVWDVTHDQSSLDVTETTFSLKGASFLGDGDRFVLAKYDSFSIRDSSSGTQLVESQGDSPGFSTIVANQDGSRLAAGANDGSVSLWDSETGELLTTFAEEHGQQVTCLDFDSDNRLLASAGEDGGVFVWDLQQGEVVFRIDGIAENEKEHDFRSTGMIRMTKGLRATTLQFAPDSQFLAIACYDGNFAIYNTQNWEQVFKLPLQQRGHKPFFDTALGDSFQISIEHLDQQGIPVDDIFFDRKSKPAIGLSAQSGILATSNVTDSVQLWDIQSQQILRTLVGHTDAVECLAFSPDGSRLATGSRDQTIKIWSVTSGQELISLTGHSHKVIDLEFSSDGRRLVSTSSDKSVRVWSAMPSQNAIPVASLAQYYLTNRQFLPAQLLLESQFKTLEERYGELDPRTLEILSILAFTQFRNGHPDAVSSYERLIESCEERWGEASLLRTAGMSNLAAYYKNVGRIDESIRLLEEVLSIRLETLGANASRTSVVYRNLIDAYIEAGKLDAVVEMLPAAYRSDPSDPRVSIFVTRAITALKQRRDQQGQFELLMELIEIARDNFEARKPFEQGDSSVTVYLFIVHELLPFFARSGPSPTLITLREESAMLFELAYSERHERTTTALHNLASLYFFAGRTEESAATFERVIQIKSAIYGALALPTLNSKAEFGETLRRSGKTERATHFLSEVVDTIGMNQALWSANTIPAFSNLAMAYADQGDYQSAVERMSLALEVMIDHEAGAPNDILMARVNMVGLIMGAGDVDAGIEEFERISGEINERIAAENNQAVLNLFAQLKGSLLNGILIQSQVARRAGLVDDAKRIVVAAKSVLEEEDARFTILKGIARLCEGMIEVENEQLESATDRLQEAKQIFETDERNPEYFAYTKCLLAHTLVRQEAYDDIDKQAWAASIEKLLELKGGLPRVFDAAQLIADSMSGMIDLCDHIEDSELANEWKTRLAEFEKLEVDE